MFDKILFILSFAALFLLSIRGLYQFFFIPHIMSIWAELIFLLANIFILVASIFLLLKFFFAEKKIFKMWVGLVAVDVTLKFIAWIVDFVISR